MVLFDSWLDTYRYFPLEEMEYELNVVAGLLRPTLLVPLVGFSLSLHIKIGLLVPQPRKRGRITSPSFDIGVFRKHRPHFCHRRVTFIYLSVLSCLSVCLSQSVHTYLLFIYLYVRVSVFIYIYLPIHAFICLFITILLYQYLPTYLHNFISISVFFFNISQIFAGWEAQTMSNLQKNVWCVWRSMF